MLVHPHDSRNSEALRPKNVTVEGKAVRSTVAFVEATAEAVDRIHLISIVLLQNNPYRLYGLQVLIALNAVHEAVERARVGYLSIRGGEVNGHLQTYLAATKNVIEEGHFLLDDYCFQTNLHFVVWQLNRYLLKSSHIQIIQSCSLLKNYFVIAGARLILVDF